MIIKFPRDMQEILENCNFSSPTLAVLLLKVLELDDAGVELISTDVDLLLRHSRLQKKRG